MLKKSINSALSIMIHVNVVLIVRDIKEKVCCDIDGDAVPQIMDLFQHVHRFHVG